MFPFSQGRSGIMGTARELLGLYNLRIFFIVHKMFTDPFDEMIVRLRAFVVYILDQLAAQWGRNDNRRGPVTNMAKNPLI